MVWFCSWFKSVLYSFALFSTLQLCSLVVCCFWCSPLPSLAWYSLLHQQKTVSAKGSKYFFCWLREPNEVSKVVVPNLGWKHLWTGVIPQDGSATLVAHRCWEKCSQKWCDGGLSLPVESQLSIWRFPEDSLLWALVAGPRLQRQTVAEPKSQTICRGTKSHLFL